MSKTVSPLATRSRLRREENTSSSRPALTSEAPDRPFRPTALLADPVFREHLAGREHPERPERFDAVVRGLQQAGRLERLARVNRRAATEQELFLCHTPEYLRTAKNDVLAGRPYLSTGDTDIRPNSWDVAPQAAGGVLNAVDAVEFPGWIPREDLHDLYARAWAFLYPSRFEGFGLPLLEALASGIPTACSKIEPLSSIAAGAALEFDPLDLTAITEVILRIATDEPLRTRLAEAGPAAPRSSRGGPRRRGRWRRCWPRGVAAADPSSGLLSKTRTVIVVTTGTHIRISFRV